MFQYGNVSREVQDTKKCTSHSNYVSVLYKDPSPILMDWNPEPVWMPDTYKDGAQQIKEFKVRSDDVWIVSYGKTGTTIVCEMISVLLNDLNFESVEETPIMRRIPFLEIGALGKLPFNPMAWAAEATNRRPIKTHLPLNLLPKEVTTKNPKIIYILRDPKDAAVSKFHHYKNLLGYPGSMEQFMEDYLTGQIMYGSYFRHADEYLQLAKLKKENLLVVTFEGMVTNMQETVKNVAQFIGKNLTEAEIATVADYLHFDQMKKRKNSNMQDAVEMMTKGKQTEFKFMRKGKNGSYKEELSPEMVSKFNKEMEKWKEMMVYFPNY